jgi:hypothetical protein
MQVGSGFFLRKEHENFGIFGIRDATRQARTVLTEVKCYKGYFHYFASPFSAPDKPTLAVNSVSGYIAKLTDGIRSRRQGGDNEEPKSHSESWPPHSCMDAKSHTSGYRGKRVYSLIRGRCLSGFIEMWSDLAQDSISGGRIYKVKLRFARPALSSDPVSLLQWQEGEPNKGNDGETGEEGYFSGGRFQDAVYSAKDQDTGKICEMRVPRPSIEAKRAPQSAY